MTLPVVLPGAVKRLGAEVSAVVEEKLGECGLVLLAGDGEGSNAKVPHVPPRPARSLQEPVPQFGCAFAWDDRAAVVPHAPH